MKERGGAISQQELKQASSIDRQGLPNQLQSHSGKTSAALMSSQQQKINNKNLAFMAQAQNLQPSRQQNIGSQQSRNPILINSQNHQQNQINLNRSVIESNAYRGLEERRQDFPEILVESNSKQPKMNSSFVQQNPALKSKNVLIENYGAQPDNTRHQLSSKHQTASYFSKDFANQQRTVGRSPKNVQSYQSANSRSNISPQNIAQASNQYSSQVQHQAIKSQQHQHQINNSSFLKRQQQALMSFASQEASSSSASLSCSQSNSQLNLGAGGEQDFFNMSQQQMLVGFKNQQANAGEFNNPLSLSSSLLKVNQGKSKITIKTTQSSQNQLPQGVNRSVTPTMLSTGSTRQPQKRIDVLNSTFIQPSSSQNYLEFAQSSFNNQQIQQPPTPTSFLNSTIQHKTVMMINNSSSQQNINPNQISQSAATTPSNLFMNTSANKIASSSQIKLGKLSSSNKEGLEGMKKGIQERLGGKQFVQPTLNIDSIEGGDYGEGQAESHYGLEQLISPNFQLNNTISMSKRLSKQTHATIQGSDKNMLNSKSNSNSTNQFHVSGNINFQALSGGEGTLGKGSSGSGRHSQIKSFFKKNSTRSSRLESPNLHQQQDSVAQSLSKSQSRKREVKKIMNDSLNMITQSRNKYINKSFQQRNNNSSSATRKDQSSLGGETTLNASGNQHLSLKKLPSRVGAETSMKKLNSTASYDILGVQKGIEVEGLDQSYGALGGRISGLGSGMPRGLGTRSPHSFAQQNWSSNKAGSSLIASNQNIAANTLNSNNLQHSQLSAGSSSLKIMQSQISSNMQHSSEKGEKVFMQRGSNGLTLNQLEVSGRNANDAIVKNYSNNTSQNVSVTNKKSNFKLNLKSSHAQGNSNQSLGFSILQQSKSIQRQQQHKQDHETLDTSDFSEKVSPSSSLPKRQLNFNSKSKAVSSNQYQMMQPNLMHNSSVTATTAPSTNFAQQSNHGSRKLLGQQFSSSLIELQQANKVRPFENANVDPTTQLKQRKNYFCLNQLDEHDFIDPNLFYQQQAISTTSQLSQYQHDVQMMEGGHLAEMSTTSKKAQKNQFSVPKISKMQLQQSFNHQSNSLASRNLQQIGCFTTSNHKASQQQFMSMGDGRQVNGRSGMIGDLSFEYDQDDHSQATMKQRSLTPQNGFHSQQHRLNYSGCSTEKFHNQSKQRRQTNQNFQQLQLIDMTQQNQTFSVPNPNDDSLMMMLNQHDINFNNSNIHNQPPSSGEDISFNIDCSQAFQLTHQTLDNSQNGGTINTSMNNFYSQVSPNGQKRVQNLNRPVTVGDISSQRQNIRRGDAQVSKQATLKGNLPQNLLGKKIDESVGGQSENLETSRFSTTLETQIKQNSSILTKNANTIEDQQQTIHSYDPQTDYSRQEMINQERINSMSLQQQHQQHQRFLKVAPNAHQIKNAMLNQVNQRKQQMQKTSEQSCLKFKNQRNGQALKHQFVQNQVIHENSQSLESSQIIEQEGEDETCEQAEEQVTGSETEEMYSQEVNQINSLAQKSQAQTSIAKFGKNTGLLMHLNVSGQVNAGGKQYFSQAKKFQGSINQAPISGQDQLKKLKREIEQRREEQLKRNEELIFENQQMGLSKGQNINPNQMSQTQVSGNNIFIINNSNVKEKQFSSIKKRTLGGGQRPSNFDRRRFNQGTAFKRDISADIALSRQYESDEDSQERYSKESSDCSCDSCLREGMGASEIRDFENHENPHSQVRDQNQRMQIQDPRIHDEQSVASSSFIESSRYQGECKECLDSKCQSRLCCQCNDSSDPCSKLSVNQNGNQKQINQNLQDSSFNRSTKFTNELGQMRKFQNQSALENQVSLAKLQNSDQKTRMDDANKIITESEIKQKKPHRSSKMRDINHRESNLSKLSRKSVRIQEGFEYGGADSSSRQSRISRRIKKDKQGRVQYIKYHDDSSNQVFRIDAPNNVFFNDELDLNQAQGFHPSFQHRGRHLKNIDDFEHHQSAQKDANLILRLNQNEQIQPNMILQQQTHNLIPVVKRNLTPDDQLRRGGAESYLLVDQKGKPRKVYIQRNVPVKISTPSKLPQEELKQSQMLSQTLDYEDQSDSNYLKEGLDMASPQFQTIQEAKKGAAKNIQSQRKKFLNGTGSQKAGESSLICCLSTKAQRDYGNINAQASTKSKASENSNRSRCLVQ